MMDSSTTSLDTQDFRLIPLRGKRGVGRYAKVSPHHYERLSQYAWYVKGHPGNDYPVRAILVNKTRYYVGMHQDVLSVPEGMDVDHVNGDRYDNRESNLRCATRSQNMANRRARGDVPGSPYIGVHYHKCSGKYVAHITQNKKAIHLGSFDDPEYAARVRDGAAIYLFGEFAALQVPHLEPIPYTPRPRKIKTSQYAGVYFCKNIGKWAALCSQNHKDYNVGTFDSEIDAAIARDNFARSNGIKVRRYNFPT